MISSKMAERLNEQLNVELFASYQYLAISAYCLSLSLRGFGNWFAMQSSEEREHAMKIYHYLLDQDSSVNLMPIKQPKNDFANLHEAVETALNHEKHVTACINSLASFATTDQDHATNIFLHWFVSEQVEEEATIRDLVEQLKLTGDSGEGIILLDRELAGRKPEVASKS